MKKSNRLILGLAFAALTFGGLYAAFGSKDYRGCCHKAQTEQTEATADEVQP